MWQCDFRSKKVPRADKFDHGVLRGESEFLSALNAFLAHFVHKTLKDEQVECIRRIVCHGRDILAVLPTGFGKSAIHLSVDSKNVVSFKFVP